MQFKGLMRQLEKTTWNFEYPHRNNIVQNGNIHFDRFERWYTIYSTNFLPSFNWPAQLFLF